MLENKKHILRKEKTSCNLSISKYKVCFTALISLMLLSSIIVTGKNSGILRPPVADAGGPYTGKVGMQVYFNGYNSYDPPDVITIPYCSSVSVNSNSCPLEPLSSPEGEIIDDTIKTQSASIEVSSDYSSLVPGKSASSLESSNVNPERDNSAEDLVIAPSEGNPDKDPTIQNPSSSENKDTTSVTSVKVTDSEPTDDSPETSADVDSDVKEKQTRDSSVNQLEGNTPEEDSKQSSPVQNTVMNLMTDIIEIPEDNSIIALPGDEVMENPQEPSEVNPDGLSFRWDFNGDGEYDTGWLKLPTATHIYSAANTYTVTLEVMDKDNLTATDSTIAVIGADGSPELPPKVEGLTVWDTQAGGQLALSWDLCDTNVNYYQIYRDNEPIYSTSVNYYKDNKLINGITYWYEVSAINDDGEGPRSDPAGGTPTDSNIPPIADAGDGYFQWIEPILFDASDSYDPDGYIIGYRWDFDGDKQFDTAWLDIPTIFYWHDNPGTYNVILEVMDNESATDNDTTVATVVDDNELPVADAGGPYSGFINESILFIGSNSYDPDGTIVNYTWDFGDGIIGYGVTETHVYTKNGTFEVKLTVKDNRSGINIDTTHAEIRDENENRAPSKPDVTVRESENVKNEYILTVDSTDPDDDMVMYVIKWGDDTITESPYFPSGTALTSSHTYIIEGKYNVTVYAKDELGANSEGIVITIQVKDSIGNTFYNQLSEGQNSLSEDMQYIIMIGILSTIGFVFIGVFLYKRRSYDFEDLK